MSNLLSVLSDPVAIRFCLAIVFATLILESWWHWASHPRSRRARCIAATIGVISFIASITIISLVRNPRQVPPHPVPSVERTSAPQPSAPVLAQSPARRR